MYNPAINSHLVSVIIPSYNSEKFIAETLDSVIAQSWENLEIIVVDDGSNDATVQVIRQYQDLGVICLTQENRGACAARNYGYRMSKGDFIQFLDADDIISPDKIEKQLNQLLATVNYETKMIHCRWGRFYNDDLDNVKWWGPHELIRRSLKPADWLIANHMSNTHCWLIPRSLIQQAGLWDETLYRNQDGEFFSRLIVHADEVLYCDEVKVYYRSGISTSISRNRSRAAAESTLKSIELIESHLFSLEESDRARLTIANMYQDFIYGNFIYYPDLAQAAEAKVKALGGASVKLQGGVTLKALEKLLGWKTALLIKKNVSTLTK